MRAARGCDVIVVGAGPAGSTAARALALGGARVLVLDRAAFPRSKPCGGGLTCRVLKRFPYLPPALDRIGTHVVHQIYMESPGGQSVTIDAPQPLALLVRRVEFDGLLLDLARRAGAELQEGVDIRRVSRTDAGVRLEAQDGRSFESPLVVAADGVYSVVARRLGFNVGWPREAMALDMMEETPNARMRATDTDTLWVSFAHGRGHGYGYVFPKRDHVNVGVGYSVSSYKSDIAEPAYAVHKSFVTAMKRRGVLCGEPDRACFTPYQIPIGGPLPVTARGGVFLAGDAGGFVNAFTAEGIYFAMVSGELAAQAILRGPSERLYQRLWRKELGSELRDSKWLAWFLYTDLSRLDRLVRGMRVFPEVTRMLADYTVGDHTYTGVRRRFLLRFPRLGFKLVTKVILKGLRDRLPRPVRHPRESGGPGSGFPLSRE